MRIRGGIFLPNVLLMGCLCGLTMRAQNEATTLDVTTPLGQRVVDTPAAVLQHLQSLHLRVALHTLSASERGKIVRALAALPSFESNALVAHVRSISLVDGRFANGMTIASSAPSGTLYDIVVNAPVLDETVSAFLTRKERGCYRSSASGAELTVEAGSQDAVLYVLLHEAMHVVDQISPAQISVSYAAEPPRLAAHIWKDSLTVDSAYQSPFLGGGCFRHGIPDSIEDVQATYEALRSSPFVSLYGSSNPYDDSADLVAVYHLTHVLHEPYRIILRAQERTILSIEPMASPAVKRRFSGVEALYK